MLHVIKWSKVEASHSLVLKFKTIVTISSFKAPARCHGRYRRDSSSRNVLRDARRVTPLCATWLESNSRIEYQDNCFYQGADAQCLKCLTTLLPSERYSRSYGSILAIELLVIKRIRALPVSLAPVQNRSRVAMTSNDKISCSRNTPYVGSATGEDHTPCISIAQVHATNVTAIQADFKRSHLSASQPATLSSSTISIGRLTGSSPKPRREPARRCWPFQAAIPSGQHQSATTLQAAPLCFSMWNQPPISQLESAAQSCHQTGMYSNAR